MSRSAGFASLPIAPFRGVAGRACVGFVSASGLAFAWVGRRRATWLAYGLRGASWASGYVLLEGSGVGAGRKAWGDWSIYLYIGRGAMGWAVGVGEGWVQAWGDGVGGVAIDIYGYGSAAWAFSLWLDLGVKKRSDGWSDRFSI